MKKSYLKKLIATTMAVGIGVLSMFGGVAPVFADPFEGLYGEQLDPGDWVEEIRVKNVEEGAVVTAYQLVDGYYSPSGSIMAFVPTFDFYSSFFELNFDMECPSAESIMGITNAIVSGQLELDPDSIHILSPDGADYTAEVEPGLYLILVSNSGGSYVYNPALVAVNVWGVGDRNDEPEVDMTGFFQTAGQTAWVKSSTTDIDKKIVVNQMLESGSAASYGDIIEFKLSGMQIPSFSGSGAYQAPVFRITDTWKEGAFTNLDNLVVKVSGVEVDEGDAYTLTTEANGFIIEFYSDYLLDVANNSTVEVTYEVELADTAGLNWDENYNHVKLEYTNDIYGNLAEKTDNAYIYSFSLGGLIDGEGSHHFDVFEKVERRPDGELGFAVEGAEFTLFTEDMDFIATATSDSNGHFQFDGLNVGNYVLRETHAPDGYALLADDIYIRIYASFDDSTGILLDWGVEVNGERVLESFNDDTNRIEENGDARHLVETSVETLKIPNATLQSLPSTGGTGTAITLGISAVMAATAGAITVVAKKKAKDEE